MYSSFFISFSISFSPIYVKTFQQLIAQYLPIIFISDCWSTLKLAPSCKGSLPAYYFDVSSKTCRLTTFRSGCNGVTNVFKTLEECDYVATKICKPAFTKVLAPAPVKEIIVSPPREVLVSSPARELIIPSRTISYGTPYSPFPVAYDTPFSTIFTPARPAFSTYAY